MSPALTRRDRVGWADLAWLVWRQHRILIAVTTLGIAIASALDWWDAADVANSSAYQGLANVVVPSAAGLVGVFWGAPLLASEYEQRTHLVAWAQDVSPMRWLTGKRRGSRCRWCTRCSGSRSGSRSAPCCAGRSCPSA
jgi:hypothetical protein